MPAAKEVFPFRLIPSSAAKTLMTRERTYLPCGCQVFIGLIMGSNEGASATVPCSPEHAALVRSFQEAWMRSIELEPSPRPAIDIAAELLATAADREETAT